MARKLFTISPKTRNLAAAGIDTMITELGKECLLVFDSTRVRCSNCHFDTTRNQSAGVYNGTGPRPFTRPPCPVCRGAGLIDVQHAEVAKFLIDWQPKNYEILQAGIVAPRGVVRTKGFIDDLPKVIQCKYIIIDYKNDKYNTNKFVRAGEPIPQGNIVPNRYFNALWQRST